MECHRRRPCGELRVYGRHPYLQVLGWRSDVGGRQLRAALADHRRQRVGHSTGRVVKTSPLNTISIGSRGHTLTLRDVVEPQLVTGVDLEVDERIDLG